MKLLYIYILLIRYSPSVWWLFLNPTWYQFKIDISLIMVIIVDFLSPLWPFSIVMTPTFFCPLFSIWSQLNYSLITTFYKYHIGIVLLPPTTILNIMENHHFSCFSFLERKWIIRPHPSSTILFKEFMAKALNLKTEIHLALPPKRLSWFLNMASNSYLLVINHLRFFTLLVI